MTSLRVAHVSTPLTYRGGENQALLLMRGLMKRGNECFLFTPPGAELATRARSEGVQVLEVGGRSELNVVAIGRMAGHISKIKPDVIQFHDGHAVTLGGAAARLAGLKTRVATRRVDYRLRSSWKWRRFAEMVIAISKTVKDILISDGIPSERIRVVHSAVNTLRLVDGDASRARASLGIESAKRIILCSAAFTSQKAHDVLIEAMPRVCEACPDVVLLLAGEGELKAGVERRARELGLVPECVQFIGWRDDINDLLAASDLFVMSSRFEGLCTAVLEAMWAGVPVVATDAGGLPEAVGDAGRVVKSGDSNALADAMIAALKDTADTERMKGLARERVDREFSADSLADGTLAVYNELMSAHSVRRTP